MPFTVDSGTDTASGLNQAAATLYDASSGARQDAKKVAVLVTDGRSNSFSSTQSAAEALKVRFLARTDATLLSMMWRFEHYNWRIDFVVSVPTFQTS